MSSPTAAGPTAVTGPRSLVAIGLVGVAAGLLAGLFGVGGGILIVPGLVLAAGMDQRLAHGTSLAAVVPISVSSLVVYATQTNVDWAAAAWLIVGAVAGAVIGSKLLAALPTRTLALLFAGVLILSAVRLFFDVEADGRPPLTVLAAVGLVVVGLTSGTLAGLLGVGGGVIMIPAMILGFGILPVLAKGTSAAVIIPTAVMGTWRNSGRGHVDLRAAIVIGLAGVLTAAIGGVIADRMSSTLSNTLFATLLIVVAARLLWQLHGGRDQHTPTPGAKA